MQIIDITWMDVKWFLYCTNTVINHSTQLKLQIYVLSSYPLSLYRFFTMFRSNRLQMFFKIGVLRNFANFTGKHLCWSLFLIKSQARRPGTLLKSDSKTGVFFCEICEIFKNTFFYRTPAVMRFLHVWKCVVAVRTRG